MQPSESQSSIATMSAGRDARRHLIYGDCARPETISQIHNAGFRIEPAARALAGVPRSAFRGAGINVSY
jgi:hypothetical protein